MELTRTVGLADGGRVLGHYLTGELGISSRLLKKLKAHSLITVNGGVAHTDFVLSEGDALRIDMGCLSGPAESIVPERIPLDVLYEDEFLIVVNKQAGLIIHPSAIEGAGTVSNGLAHYYARTGTSAGIHPISRLDRNTTGAILFAKDCYTADRLARSMRAGAIYKEYLGVVHGAPEPGAGIIDLPLGRVHGSIVLRAVRCDGRVSRTYYETVRSAHGMSLLLLSPRTGRTHQLRVHMTAIGHPLLSDGLYIEPASGMRVRRAAGLSSVSGAAGINCTRGAAVSLPAGTPRTCASPPSMPEFPEAARIISRQALHSFRLTFTHPYTKRAMTIAAPPPPDFMALINYMSIIP